MKQRLLSKIHTQDQIDMLCWRWSFQKSWNANFPFLNRPNLNSISLFTSQITTLSPPLFCLSAGYIDLPLSLIEICNIFICASHSAGQNLTVYSIFYHLNSIFYHLDSILPPQEGIIGPSITFKALPSQKWYRNAFALMLQQATNQNVYNVSSFVEYWECQWLSLRAKRLSLNPK